MAKKKKPAGKQSSYEKKYGDFIRLLADGQMSQVMIDRPEDIGETYEELIESLNRIADAHKKLSITPTRDRPLPRPVL